MKNIGQIIEEQVRRWEFIRSDKTDIKQPHPVVTISREPGSGGKVIAKTAAKILGFDLFHQELIHEMAKNAKVGRGVIKTIDEKGLSMLDDWVKVVISEKHLWPDEYSKVLMKVVGVIGKHGKAVLVGRGANFILPPENRFRIRVIAPLDFRVKKVSEANGIPLKEAKRRVIRTESDRKAFIRKYFHSNIADPLHYDMILNTGVISVEKAAAAIVGLIK